tara:strand:- start:885 stop:1145 length:261 start_codon:yes stop_codon:yes gene_type:complete
MSVQYFSPITEANYAGNTTINTSTYVRAYNNDDNAHLIAITTGPITIGSFTLGPAQEAFIKKEPTHLVNVAASAYSASIKLTGVDF